MLGVGCDLQASDEGGAEAASLWQWRQRRPLAERDDVHQLHQAAGLLDQTDFKGTSSARLGRGTGSLHPLLIPSWLEIAS